MTLHEDVISAAMSLAGDVADGKVDPAELNAELIDTCRSLMGTVVPDDPLWALHVDVAHQVLAAGGLSVEEIAEWLAVRQRAQRFEDDQKPLAGPDMPAEPDSAASGPHNPETSASE